MIRLAEAPVATQTPPLPRRWAQPRTDADSLAEAAFRAGAALNELDAKVRSDPPWAGAWRQRLALTGAAAAVRRLGLKEDEANLRDAWHLRGEGADPGPAGRVYGAWRLLAARPVELDERILKTIAEALATPWRAALGDVPARLARLDRSAPFAAAALVADILAIRPEAELLAWWAADVAIAGAMRWPVAVPLLMGRLHTDVFRSDGRGRIRPGGEDFERGALLGVGDRRDRRLPARRRDRPAGGAADRAVAPKLRAKGAGEAIQRLLADDAVPGSLTTPNLTRWGSRRLFERLVALDAVRELTGRATFR